MNNNKVLGIIILLVAIASFLGGASFNQWQTQKQGTLVKAGATPSPAQEPTQAQEVLGELTSTIGNFLILKEEVCREDDKPIIYFFGSQGCPHCSWEHPIFEEAVSQFGGLVSFHNNMDKSEDVEVFQRYYQINGGGIPFMVLGCQYARAGSGERSGEETERANLTALICRLTDNQPEAVCGEVESLIEQVGD